ncbi:hypothetical protein ACLK19_06795 [Escherichia coli]
MKHWELKPAIRRWIRLANNTNTVIRAEWLIAPNRILVNNLPQGVEEISVTEKREHMAATVTTEAAGASLRSSWLVQRLVNDRDFNNNVLNIKIFLPLVGATVFVNIALAIFQPYMFHSRWAAGRNPDVPAGADVQCPGNWFTHHLLLMAVFSPIFTGLCKVEVFAVALATLPCPRADAYP